MTTSARTWVRRAAATVASTLALPLVLLAGPAVADDAVAEIVADAIGTVVYTGPSQVQAAPALELPIEIAGAPAATALEVAAATLGETVPISGTEVEVEIGSDGAGSATIPAGVLEPGAYVLGVVREGAVVPDADQVRADVVVLAATPGPAPEEAADPEATDPAPEPAPEERPAAEDAPAAQPASAPEPAADSEQGEVELYNDYARALYDADGDGVLEVPTPVPGSGGAGHIPAGLQAYYTQDADLSIDNCEAMGQPELAMFGYVECGYVVVPMDAAHPGRGNLAIAVARGLAIGDAEGSLLLNPGGPGGDGMWMAMMGDAFPDLAESFDFIGFDPRGVGASVPFARCIDDADRDALFGRSNYGRTPEEIEQLAYDDAKAYADDCFANTGAVLGLDEDDQIDLVSHLGTWDAVGDVDIIRSVLGEPKLDYLGYSYGTQLGYVYAQKFPDNVGRMVLDAAVDPMPGQEVATPRPLELSADEQATVDQIAGFQDAFEQFALDCSAKGEQGLTWEEAYTFEDGYLPPGLIGAPYATYGEEMVDQPFSCPLGDGLEDTDALSAASAALIQSADAANGGDGYTTLDPEGRTLVSAGARTGVIEALYSQELWGLLAYGFWELEGRSEGTGLLALADLYNGRMEDGSYGNADAAFTTIRCTDSNPSNVAFDVDAAREFAAAYDEAAPFQASTVVVGTPDYCQFWRFTGTLPAGEELSSVPNILVISTSHDSATPYAAGVKLAQAVDGTLLSVSGATHGASASGTPCVDHTVTEFLADGALPDEGPFGPTLGRPDTALMPDGSLRELTTRCQLDSYRPTGVELSRSIGQVGDMVEVSALHLDSEVAYAVTFDHARVTSLGTDNGGNAAGSFAVPIGVEPGDHVVTVVDADGSVVERFPFRVVGATAPGDGAGGAELAETGPDDAGPLLLLATGLLVAGVGMLVLRSRRRRGGLA